MTTRAHPAGERFTGVEASLVRLGNVGDEVRLDAARLAEDLGQAVQEDVVGDRGERPAFGFEGCSARGEREPSALVVHERRVRLVMDRIGPFSKADADGESSPGPRQASGPPSGRAP